MTLFEMEIAFSSYNQRPTDPHCGANPQVNVIRERDVCGLVEKIHYHSKAFQS